MDYRERIAKVVGQNVRIVREHHGCSQGDIAEILVKTAASVGANEAGKTAFCLSDLEKICRKFKDITPNHLMGYEPLPDKYKK